MSEEKKNVKEWNEKQVADFLRNIGKGSVWEQYANVCVEQAIDGASLAIATPEDLINDYGFKPIHARLVYQNIVGLTTSSSTSPLNESQNICAKHQQPFKAQCIEDDVLVCVVCLVTTHHGKKCHDLDTALKREKEKISTFVSKAQDRKTEFKQAIEKIMERQKNVTADNDNIKPKINEFFDNVLQSLEEQRKKLLEEVQQLCKSKNKAFDTQIIVLQSAISNLDIECRKAQAQMLLFKRKFETFLTTTTVTIDPNVDSDICFFINKSDEENSQQLARVELTGASADQCIATGEGIKAACPNRSIVFTILSKSKNGKNNISGGENFVAKILNVNAEVKIEDNNDGSYTGSYTLPMGIPDSVRLSVQIRDKDIRGSPFRVHIRRNWGAYQQRQKRIKKTKGKSGRYGDKNPRAGREELWRQAVFDVSTAPELGRRRHSSIYGKEPLKIRDISKSEEEVAAILKVLKKVMFFRKMELFQLQNIINGMWKDEYKSGSIISKPGMEAKTFHIIKEGQLNIKGGINPRGKNISVGKCFGEVSLMHNMPQTKTITAVSDCVLWTVDRSSVKRIIIDSSARKFDELMAFLQGVKAFKRLTEHNKQMLAQALELETYKEGDIIVKEGEAGDTFYIVRSGQVHVTKKDAIDKEHIMELADIGPGDYFGELALTTQSRRNATVTAATPIVELFSLKKNVFTILVGSMKKIFKQRDKEYRATIARQQSLRITDIRLPISSPCSSVSSIASFNPIVETKTTEVGLNQQNQKKKCKSLKFEDLTVIGTLGRGAFGHVQLVSEEKTTPGTKKVYALKTVNKALVFELQQVEHLKNEKETLEKLNHPFLIELCQFFNTQHDLHFLLEVCMGGELKSVLEEKEYFEADEARFISGSCLIALQILHNMGIVFRDLKPENVLLTPSGYIKLVDFGFAKQIKDERTYTLCGTPDYLAPEVVSNEGHDLSVDFWTIGILIFEMLVGEPPFTDDNPMAIYQNIIRGDIEFAEDMEECEIDIINQFCTKVTARLGAIAGGYKTIRKHEFFKGFDWEGVKNQTVKPPECFVKPIENDEDLTNFEDHLGEDDRWRDWDTSVELEEGQEDPFLHF